jgi:membrane protein
MNILQKILHKADQFQQRHPVIAFPYAVVKKYGDDNGGYQAALVTYYGFLSLFPLLLVAVTVLQLVFHNNKELQTKFLEGINSYFPLLGDQLSSNIGGLGKTGLGLVVGIAITLYGARGAADALRFALDTMWQVPKVKRSGFPKTVLQSFSIMGLGALGLVVTVGASSVTSALGHAWWAGIIANIVGFIIAAVVIMLVFRVATAKSVGFKDLWVGSAIAAFGVQLILTFGTLIVAGQLKGLGSLYGTFAIVLGLLFWMYLIAQIVLYAAQIDTVRKLKLWPRALVTDNPTKADKRAYDLYAKAEERIKPETVKTGYSEE